ncbi:hypothetical protein Q7P36_008295 [Cladosporium allicinum]
MGELLGRLGDSPQKCIRRTKELTQHLPASRRKTSPPHEPISDFITTPLTTYTSFVQNVKHATSDGSDDVREDELPLSEQ